MAVGNPAESINAENLTSNVFQSLIHLTSAHDNSVKILWTAPAPTVKFIGREDLMDSAHKKLQSCTAEGHYLSGNVAVVGPAGMGKTEMARAFAQKYKAEYENVVWVGAGTERSLRDSFTRLAKALKIPCLSDDDKGRDVGELVYANVSEHFQRPALFISDNAHVIFDNNLVLVLVTLLFNGDISRKIYKSLLPRF